MTGEYMITWACCPALRVMIGERVHILSTERATRMCKQCGNIATTLFAHIDIGPEGWDLPYRWLTPIDPNQVDDDLAETVVEHDRAIGRMVGGIFAYYQGAGRE